MQFAEMLTAFALQFFTVPVGLQGYKPIADEAISFGNDFRCDCEL